MFDSKEKFLSALHSLEKRFADSRPELAVTISDPASGDPALDDPVLGDAEGYIVVWNTEIAKDGPLGPCGKGGTRIHPNVSLDEISLLAKIMALKNAAAGLPLGGAKSGLRADPQAPDFEKQYRQFVSLSRPYLREHGGILGGFGFDIGADPIHALWACDTLGSTNSFTGKPLELGGTDYDREGIAGFGVVVAASEALQFRGSSLSQARVSIQGIGAMGSAVLRYARVEGAQIVALADPRLGGCLFREQGLPAELCELLEKGEFFQAQEKAKSLELTPLPLDAIFSMACDVFFPCAMQNVITEDNWAALRCSLLVEGANSPCTREAQRKLHEAGVLLIPDFIANPGGVIAAFVELTSKISLEENCATRAKAREAKALTQEKITKNVREILRISSALALEPREVGMYLALQRIYDC